MTKLTDCYLTQVSYSASNGGQLVFVIKSPTEENFKKLRDIGNSKGPFNLTIEQPKKVELKSCPFCGSTNVVRATNGIVCDDCRILVKHCPCCFDTRDLESRWNQRVKE